MFVQPLKLRLYCKSAQQTLFLARSDLLSMAIVDPYATLLHRSRLQLCSVNQFRRDLQPLPSELSLTATTNPLGLRQPPHHLATSASSSAVDQLSGQISSKINRPCRQFLPLCSPCPSPRSHKAPPRTLVASGLINCPCQTFSWSHQLTQQAMSAHSSTTANPLPNQLFFFCLNQLRLSSSRPESGEAWFSFKIQFRLSTFQA